MNDRDVLLQAAQRSVDPRANKYLALAVTTPFFHVSPTGVPTPSTITVQATPVNIGGGTVQFSAGSVPLTVTGNQCTINFSDMPVDSVTLVATITDLGQTYTASQVIAKVQDGAVGQPGTPATLYATAYLYKWSTSQPALPQGTSTLSWNVGANTSYVGTDGWYVSAPANPGTPGIQLWIAQKAVSAAAGTQTTDIIYTVGATLAAFSQNGATGTPGIKTTKVTAYQWANGPAPTATGSATYTWASGTYNTPPSGWTISKTDAPALGYTLFEASVGLVDSTGSATSFVDWTKAAVTAVSYMPANGATGSSAMIAYTLVDGNSLNTTPSYVTTSGQNLPTTGTWGETRAWSTTVPIAAAGQAVFQSNGIYNAANSQTTWGVPYLSALRVGNLSAITVNTGDLNISGTVSSSNGNFIVDSNGNAQMKSITIKDASGNVVLSSGTKLNIDYAPTYTVVTDNRNVNTAPNDYPVGRSHELKTCTVIGLTTSSTTCVVETTKGWLDSSVGGNATQYAYVSSSETWKRSAANNATSWGAWVRDLDRSLYTGDLDATKGATFGVNIGGKITASNISTYIASAAITDAYIGSLSANSITTGTLTAASIYLGGGAFQANATTGAASMSGVSISVASCGNLWNPNLAPVSATTANSSPAAAVSANSLSSNGVEAAGHGSGKFDFYAYSQGYGPFTGSHDIVWDKDDEVGEIGDIVIDKECVARSSVSNTLFRVERSSAPKQRAAVGVLAGISGSLADGNIPAAFVERFDTYTSEDGSMETYQIPTTEYKLMKDEFMRGTVNSVGEGQINVCGENGDIEAGDFIVTSSIPGKGMRQDDDIVRSITVARARESVSFDSPTQVKMIACIYLCG